MDERTVAYILAAHRPFDDLRQAMAQVSGWLVLAALHTSEAAADHPALTEAERLVREAVDAVRAMRSAEQARAHRDCLLNAGRALESAIASARTSAGVRTDDDIRRLSAMVKAAYAHLSQATSALPGFQMVSFAHACCNQPSRITNQESQ